ncbi:hypothetical protein BCR34DRAFT_160472 [Clohesyomyces aquaticus]|uniref:Uncharacterized protein n=1 Tax=Clohesyomyces aquaticus TaxID=1231657 RepID=A0A1Y1YI81_9PLEO|nr:hypothetical protein BCR34DRAFT_160472 [Clohesyomyces aquaticus]
MASWLAKLLFAVFLDDDDPSNDKNKIDELTAEVAVLRRKLRKSENSARLAKREAGSSVRYSAALIDAELPTLHYQVGVVEEEFSAFKSRDNVESELRALRKTINDGGGARGPQTFPRGPGRAREQPTPRRQPLRRTSNDTTVRRFTNEPRRWRPAELLS